jgi:YggT family protein
MAALVPLIRMFFTFYTLLILFRSFMPLMGIDPYHPAAQFIYRVTEPILAPIRSQMPPTGRIDWSPMVAIILLWIIEMVLVSLLA